MLTVDCYFICFCNLLRVVQPSKVVDFTEQSVLVHCSVNIHMTKGPPAQFFFFWGGACFLFPRSLSFYFCYDLDIWTRSSIESVFCCYLFFNSFIKSMRGLRSNMAGSCINIWQLTLLLLTFN